ncbi:RagB/SusD family nutrient uptake outer membrane protein [uncultured Sunxiuqinia sp.]|uniref:RagB/SusD family nutrient uptake outer membrane protein n=1 Tax=uncultured Sunxiuqinia sp. TaxID=1573825 RepID=UPI002AA7CF09|nr:RagB/SusD family nutrient uptake outer membrane protein [uncultured Sunxiuqinia sp.]
MKKLSIILIFLSTLSLCSCDDWLTVEPKDQVTANKAFSDRSGFSAAFSGIYQLMEQAYSPGGFMMGGGTDLLANVYTAPDRRFSPFLYTCTNHSYDDSYFDSGSGAAFLGLYKILANINELLEHIETTDVLKAEEQAMMEGEAKALRALIQFDLWRIYGSTPATSAQASELVLPYVIEMKKDRMTYSNYVEYFDLLTKDLEDARTMMHDNDPIVKYSNYELNGNSEIEEYGTELNWYYRQNRMNYYAVLGLSARVALWMDDKENAFAFAEEVVTAVNSDGTPKFTLGSSNNIAVGDFAFFTEHLFGVATPDYDDKSYNAYEAHCVNNENNMQDEVYKNYTTDLRYRLLFTTISNNALTWGAKGSLKYSNMSENDPGPKNIPIIRLSEMYLILVETAPELASAQSYYTTFTNSRFDGDLQLTESNRQDAVLDQYLREFWAEGQIFYAWKRLNMPTLPVAETSMNEDKYRVSLPTGETNISM